MLGWIGNTVFVTQQFDIAHHNICRRVADCSQQKGAIYQINYPSLFLFVPLFMSSFPYDSFLQIQQTIVDAVNQLEAQGVQDKTYTIKRLQPDPWVSEGALSGAHGNSYTLQDGRVFERGGVMLSYIAGDALPAAASRSQLAGKPYQAGGVSVVLHPRNPWVPTVHFNVRLFMTQTGVWWFGGGMDLTPYYGFSEDAQYFHDCCAQALQPFGEDLYPQFKQNCDSYFYLPHRKEARGIGGVFFDDFNRLSFEESIRFITTLTAAFCQAYRVIVSRREPLPYTQRQRDFQAYRRGRYVEFNLLYDRGTLFGLQSQGRVDAILVSLPPAPRWYYEWHDAPDYPQKNLSEQFLTPRDWLSSDLSSAMAKST